MVVVKLLSNMVTLNTILIGLLLAVCTSCQQDKQRASSTSSSKSLEPWLLGLTAMVVFLFIVFILMIINRVWCKKKKNEYEEDYSNKQRVDMNVYTNDGLEAEPAYEEMTEKPQNKAKWENENEEQKITEM